MGTVGMHYNIFSNFLYIFLKFYSKQGLKIIMPSDGDTQREDQSLPEKVPQNSHACVERTSRQKGSLTGPRS